MTFTARDAMPRHLRARARLWLLTALLLTLAQAALAWHQAQDGLSADRDHCVVCLLAHASGGTGSATAAMPLPALSWRVLYTLPSLVRNPLSRRLPGAASPRAPPRFPSR